jgi:flavodoxin
MKKGLVAYYSHSGTTKRIAEQIHKVVGGDLFEIREATPYPRDYNAVLDKAKHDINNGFKPTLKDKIPEICDYDLIIVGSPNWWSTIAPPVATFLTRANYSNKTIAPFITHGGGGLGHTIEDIRKLCPGANVLEGFDANRSSQIQAWLKSLLNNSAG